MSKKPGAKGKVEVVVKKEEKKQLEPLPEGVANVMADLSKKQAFKKFSYRGHDITSLLNMNVEEIVKLFRSRQKRRFQRKLKPEYGRFIEKLNKIKQYTAQGDKPLGLKTHLRDLIILPSMVLSIINVHNGKEFVPVEIKPEMIGYYLGEFAQSYRKVSHGKPGVGATAASKFTPIK